MPGVAPLPLGHHGDSFAIAGSSMSQEEVGDLEVFSNPSELLVSPPWSLPPLEMTGEDLDEVQLDSSWSQDGDLGLERRWVLWHEFMKEHAHLDTWLQLAEQAVSSPNSAQVTYVTAKEELRKFERLRCEAGCRLVQLDSLTRRNRSLTRLFQGSMRVRVLALARDCGQRWDAVNIRLEAITRRLKYFVSEREGFEAEREELALWLADLDIRLTEVEHLTGNNCDKMRELQAFQASVHVNSGRVNGLLERGEALIQRSEPSDAQDVESELLDLLHHCSHVFHAIGRLHTRLLSMRLVFEDDCIVSQAPDSGCPSETLLEDEGVLDKPHLDLPTTADPTQELDLNQSANPFTSDPPLPPPCPSPSTHDHLVLEWDPSVDIGGSVSRDDADSSYFSANTGLSYRDQPPSRDGVKRWSYLSSLGSRSDITNDITNQEADPLLDGWLGHAHPKTFSPIVTREGRAQLSKDLWATSTPDGQVCEPVSFDRGRVRAWLGVQNPTLLDRTTSCSKAVQTDGMVQSEEELSSSEEEEVPIDQSEHCVTSSIRGLWPRISPAFLYLFLATALTLLACLVWGLLEPPCHRSNRLPNSLHLSLRYVNGPPPT